MPTVHVTENKVIKAKPEIQISFLKPTPLVFSFSKISVEKIRVMRRRGRGKGEEREEGGGEAGLAVGHLLCYRNLVNALYG